MLKNYAEHVPVQYLPEAYNEIKTKFGNNYKKYVDWLYSKSMLLVKGHKFYNDEKTLEDPGILLGVQLVMVYQKVLADYATKEDAIANEEKKLCEAKVQMEMDMPHYSDANFTMRLSYGQVGGYMLGGFDSNYYTAAESIVEKMKKGKKLEDYKVEPVMMELMSAKTSVVMLIRQLVRCSFASLLTMISLVVTQVLQCSMVRVALLVLLSTVTGIAFQAISTSIASSHVVLVLTSVMYST